MQDADATPNERDRDQQHWLKEHLEESEKRESQDHDLVEAAWSWRKESARAWPTWR